MKIIFLSSKNNWISKELKGFIKELKKRKYIVKHIFDHREITKADFVFILGYHKIIPKAYLKINKYNFVVHESNLPKGRGWSPITWTILNNKNKIFFSLIKAEDIVDTGYIYLKKSYLLKGNETFDEIKNIQFYYTKLLCNEFLNKYSKIIKNPKKQIGTPSYFNRRYPKNSKVSSSKKISEIFNLLRVSDYKKYPVFFIYKRRKFKIQIEPYD